eukprot:125460-Chlamydomonas_euryale.AAC.1
MSALKTQAWSLDTWLQRHCATTMIVAAYEKLGFGASCSAWLQGVSFCLAPGRQGLPRSRASGSAWLQGVSFCLAPGRLVSPGT